MSHYTEIRTEIRREHQDCLVRALQQVPTLAGTRWTPAQVEVHAEPQHLYGYKGDRREQRAHIIVRRQHVGTAANDIGVEWVDGRAVFHVSEWDLRHGYGQKWQDAVKQRYAVEVAKKAAPMGYQVTETTLEDGSIVLEMRRA